MEKYDSTKNVMVSTYLCRFFKVKPLPSVKKTNIS